MLIFLYYQPRILFKQIQILLKLYIITNNCFWKSFPILFNFFQGHPRLTAALSKLYSKLTGRTINPTSELLITAGAYEALFVCITGHVDTDDEVIIIEPFFDCYEPMVKSCGGVCRFIPLRLVKFFSHTGLWLYSSSFVRGKPLDYPPQEIGYLMIKNWKVFSTRKRRF